MLSKIPFRYLLLGVVLYFLSPYDLLPDFLGLPGRLDDFALILYLIFRYFWDTSALERRLRAELKQKAPIAEPGAKPRTAHEVLGVTPTASKEEISRAYRHQVALYHPDKVAHLGKDLQDLAHERMLELQQAYEKLCP